MGLIIVGCVGEECRGGRDRYGGGMVGGRDRYRREMDRRSRQGERWPVAVRGGM